MNYSYPPVVTSANYAMYLVAKVIEQARRDFKDHEHNCPVLSSHTVDYCAQGFIARLNDYMAINPEADTTELALEVLLWLQ